MPMNNRLTIGKYLGNRLRLKRLHGLLRHRHRDNAVFIWIPKTAGTSLFSLLEADKYLNLHQLKSGFVNKGRVTFGHMKYRDLVSHGHVSKSFDNTAFKFAITRNPYHRAVSLYSYLRGRGQVDDSLGFLDFLRSLKSEGITPIGLYNVRGLSQCNPQIRWVEGVRLDFLGRFEDLNADVEEILASLGLPLRPLPKKNRTHHGEFRDYYCPEARCLVRDLYKEDFEAFGYSKEPV